MSGYKFPDAPGIETAYRAAYRALEPTCRPACTMSRKAPFAT
jgi:hypothetical protein